jgi:hypothetical protein
LVRDKEAAACEAAKNIGCLDWSQHAGWCFAALLTLCEIKSQGSLGTMRELENNTRDNDPQASRLMSSEHEYLTVVETAMKARLSPKITRSEGVHHAGRKVVIHWPTFEQVVLQGGGELGGQA